MTLLLLLAGAGSGAVVVDAAGNAYLEEVTLYGAALDETPIYQSANDENTTQGIQLDETR